MDRSVLAEVHAGAVLGEQSFVLGTLWSTSIEVTSDALVYIVKEGTRIYKEIEVFSRNIYTGATTRHVKREEISPNQVPSKMEELLNERMKVKILEQQT
jgi:hypothetical protein